MEASSRLFNLNRRVATVGGIKTVVPTTENGKITRIFGNTSASPAKLKKRSSFIRDKMLRPKSVMSIGAPSTRFVSEGMFTTRRRAVPPLKANSRYIIRHQEELCTSSRRAQSPSALYALSITRRYPARNITSF